METVEGVEEVDVEGVVVVEVEVEGGVVAGVVGDL